VIVLDERVELGMAETARKENLSTIDDIEEVDYAHHPLVETTERLQENG
jgi:IMP dehydrogenase